MTMKSYTIMLDEFETYSFNTLLRVQKIWQLHIIQIQYIFLELQHENYR